MIKIKIIFNHLTRIQIIFPELFNHFHGEPPSLSFNDDIMKYFWFHIFHKEIGDRGDRGIRETADQANWAETF